MEVDFSVSRHPTRPTTSTDYNDVAIVWLFGLLRIPLRPEKEQNKPVAKNKAMRTKRFGWRKALSLLQSTSFRKRCFRYLRHVVRSIKFKKFDLQARLGLDDPADTGQLWGFIGPIAALLTGRSGGNVRIEPDFACETFSLHSHGRIRMIPLRILLICIAFFLSPEVIRVLAPKS